LRSATTQSDGESVSRGRAALLGTGLTDEDVVLSLVIVEKAAVRDDAERLRECLARAARVGALCRSRRDQQKSLRVVAELGSYEITMSPKIIRPRNRIIIANHLVLMGYGHWLPNDLRGSGSDEIRNDLLRELGEIHHGRKWIQPSRDELREFHRDAGPLLQQEVLWFDEGMRNAIAESFAATAAMFGYVVLACAILRNHAHLVVQRHKHRHDVIWRTFAEGAKQAIQAFAGVPERHRVWGERPYSRFLYTPSDVHGRIDYVDENPEKEGLPRQHWAFVKPYAK
jgi:REP element-mobilizing transposase RayT